MQFDQLKGRGFLRPELAARRLLGRSLASAVVLRMFSDGDTMTKAAGANIIAHADTRTGASHHPTRRHPIAQTHQRAILLVGRFQGGILSRLRPARSRRGARIGASVIVEENQANTAAANVISRKSNRLQRGVLPYRLMVVDDHGPGSSR